MYNNNDDVIQVVDQYESPDEEEIEKQCSNITVNDIDIQDTLPNEPEPVYDNVDIIDEDKKDTSLMKSFIRIGTEI